MAERTIAASPNLLIDTIAHERAIAEVIGPEGTTSPLN
jgi:hypothetical protein